MAPRTLLALAVIAATSAGCLEPYVAHVDATVLAKDTRWKETPGEVAGSFLGGKAGQVLYQFNLADDQEPPFRGVLQVFSLRGLSRLDVQDLLNRAEDAVVEAARTEGIILESGHGAEGSRVLAGGATTSWFTRIGHVSGNGQFASGEEVRILGEAWYDGISRTNVVVVGMAQTTRDGTLLGLQDATDYRTWNAIVADPTGSIGGQRGNGLVYNVVSHE